jgi:ribosomal protein L7Ae-like RNA K-turn-binding protein
MISLENEKKLKSLLGMARRSRQLESGVRNVEKCIKMGLIQVVIIADDAAVNAHEKIAYISEGKEVRCFTVLNKDNLGQATGQTDKAVVGIRWGKLAEAVIEVLC